MSGGRGRPKKPETESLEKMTAMLKDVPGFLKMTEEEHAAVRESLEHSEKIRRLLLKEYGYGQSTPHAHVYKMASTGEPDAELMAADREYREAPQRNRLAGTRAKTESANERAKKICDINAVLVEKIKTSAHYSRHRVARIIHEQWDMVSDGQRLDKETICMRGDGHPAPSVRTIERWLKQQGF